jgi:hypothetical protein
MGGCALVNRHVPLLLAFLLLQPASAQDGFRILLQFPATDERVEFFVPLSRDVVLHVRRAGDVHGLHMGWDLRAVDRRLKESPNFFYECLCGHGPRPHDYYAWHFAAHYYPQERQLSVFGYPLEVRVRCPDCQVSGQVGTDARFVHGTIEISLRRLATSNPRQRAFGVEGRPQAAGRPGARRS